MQNDAQVRVAKMRGTADDCTTKIRTLLSADTSGLNHDIKAGLASTNQLIKILPREKSSRNKLSPRKRSARINEIFSTVRNSSTKKSRGGSSDIDSDDDLKNDKECQKLIKNCKK